MARPKQSKTDFVLGLPATTPALEVVALAKKHGIKISRQYVYVIRDNAKHGAKRKSRRWSSASEAELRAAIAELGLARSRQILAEMESTFQ
jgi:hypothetical protein